MIIIYLCFRLINLLFGHNELESNASCVCTWCWCLLSSSGCNCHGHSDSCHFDAARFEATGGVSGGLCDDCRHDRVGPQCERCRPFLYQDPQRAPDDPHACIRTLQLLSFIHSSISATICTFHGRPKSTLNKILRFCKYSGNKIIK